MTINYFNELVNNHDSQELLAIDKIKDDSTFIQAANLAVWAIVRAYCFCLVTDKFKNNADRKIQKFLSSRILFNGDGYPQKSLLPESDSLDSKMKKMKLLDEFTDLLEEIFDSSLYEKIAGPIGLIDDFYAKLNDILFYWNFRSTENCNSQKTVSVENDKFKEVDDKLADIDRRLKELEKIRDNIQGMVDKLGGVVAGIGILNI